jgi:ABC-type methionine transport system permease subunit
MIDTASGNRLRHIDFSWFYMDIRSPFFVLLVSLLSLSSVVGLAEVGRSQSVTEQSVSQTATINRLIQNLKSSNPKVQIYSCDRMWLMH